jgi:hypothetical protein
MSAAVAVDPTSTIDVMRELVRAYAARPQVKTVAVVGNAPIEPSDERADAIDECDAVFRCNSFVVDEPGMPRAHGRKVHVVVLNRLLRASPPVFDSYRERLYLMVEPGRLHMEGGLRLPRWPEDLGVLPVPNREITLPLSDALGLDSRNDRVWATTGLMSAWIARTLFPEAELRLAGYSMLEDTTQTEWKHAWGDSCVVGLEHRIEPEGALLRRWIDDGEAQWLP